MIKDEYSEMDKGKLEHECRRLVGVLRQSRDMEEYYKNRIGDEDRAERLQAVDVEGAALEGFPSIGEFRFEWERIYAKKPDLQWVNNPWVWVVRFERKGI